MSLTKIGSIGINTGIQFAGVTTVSTLHVGSGVTLSSDGDIFATGISTFSEDIKVGSGVTISPDGDIFATGISTFSEDIKVGSGVTISPDGDGFYTGVVTATTFSGALAASSLTGALPAISGANLTNLDASDLASGTVPTARLGSGTASSSTFLRGDSTFQTVNTDLVGDTSPQLGGNLDVNTKNILFGDSSDGSSDDVLIFGAGSDLKIYHDPNENVIESTSAGDFKIKTGSTINITKASSEDIAKFIPDGAVELYHNNEKVFSTESQGIQVLATEGTSAFLRLYADQGDDNADLYWLKTEQDGTGFYIQNNVGGSTETNFRTVGNGTVELYHDNTKRFETTAGGFIAAGGNLEFDDTSATDRMLLIGTDNSSTARWSSTRQGIKIAGTNPVLYGHTTSNSKEAYVGLSNGQVYLGASESGKILFQTAGSGTSTENRWYIMADGHFEPASDNAFDIGSSTYRVRNVYTTDLQLSNKGKTNDVDGTWGDYTIQEGESDLFLINNRSGKKYKFNLTEVS